jgi:AbrB family looped-hinge helix DNA binding protein
MSALATTRMSSKGQVVIPEDVRNSMGLRPGDQFVVLGEKGTLILKSIEKPDMSQFDRLISMARKQAKLAGLKKSDIARAIASVRGSK